LAYWTGIALAAVAVPIVIFTIGSARRPSDRRLAGILWDVLTFWPRRYHPLAVRPYAERSVPEIQARIERHVGNRHPVIICAHSQGSILAYAAIAQLSPEDRSRVAFITYGSPLRALHGRYFPRYFKPETFPEVAGGLAHLDIVAWKNFWRDTDYVGRQLFAEGDGRVADEHLPDPPAAPLIDDVALDVAGPPWPDPPPPPFTKLSIHSRYLSEPELRRWVDDIVRPALEEEP
jgi:hypothetical protein